MISLGPHTINDKLSTVSKLPLPPRFSGDEHNSSSTKTLEYMPKSEGGRWQLNAHDSGDAEISTVRGGSRHLIRGGMARHARKF